MEDLKQDKELYHNLKTLAETEGGQILIHNLINDIISTMHWLANSYEDNDLKDITIRARCAKLQGQLQLLKTLTNAKKNEEDIDNLIAEALVE